MQRCKTESTPNNYLIAIDGGEYPESEKKLSEFLLQYTDSMGLQVSDYARSQGVTGNKIINDITLVKKYAYNFWEILNAINKGL